jgi:hypothetical protein
VSFLGRALLVAALTSMATAAHARPAGTSVLCETYPSSATCAGTSPRCTLCHTSTGAEPDWNDYGYAVLDELFANPGYTADDASFIASLPASLRAIEAADHDGDGINSLEEIEAGTGPGDALDFFRALPSPLGGPNPAYRVGAYDPAFAFARIQVAYCGASPSYEEKQAFLALPNDSARRAALHDALDACLRTDHWRNQELPSLADDRIKPIPRFEQWHWDYRLWRYANLPPCDAADVECGDSLPRSARDLLTGDYHVREPAAGKLVRDPLGVDSLTSCSRDQDCDFDERCQNSACRNVGGSQPLQDRTKRAGMVTTSWFHFFFTMFSAMPRTTAAQAYRAYLGVDFARQEGLVYNAAEPADVDNKGVDGVGCYECHMHLDAAAYAFSFYRGIEGGGASSFSALRPVARGLWPTVGDARQAFFFNQPVADLVDWSQRAAASDLFKRNHTLTFFRHAVGRDPLPDEEAELQALWRSMDEDGYETPRLLHRLIDTNAFGVP